MTSGCSNRRLRPSPRARSSPTTRSTRTTGRVGRFSRRSHSRMPLRAGTSSRATHRSSRRGARIVGSARGVHSCCRPISTRSTRTRGSWHRLAEHVVAPARHRSNGKIGLRFTRGGFGTPFFGADEQVRVARDGFHVVRGGARSVHPITTVRAAADVVGIEPGAPADVYTPTTALQPDAPLELDADSARFLGDWFGFGASVLEALRAAVPDTDTPARVQLWPEHFDLSFDFGDEAAGTRATYGASPATLPTPLRTSTSRRGRPGRATSGTRAATRASDSPRSPARPTNAGRCWTSSPAPATSCGDRPEAASSRCG